jgi:hypothetical protein
MTCFWDSIVGSLDSEDLLILGHHRRIPATVLVATLKSKNTLTKTLWQGEPLRDQERREHYQAIREYDPAKIRHGHLTSTCDSFLLLLSHLLRVNVRHRFLNTTISYTTVGTPRKTLKFSSNRGHFVRSS